MAASITIVAASRPISIKSVFCCSGPSVRQSLQRQVRKQLARLATPIIMAAGVAHFVAGDRRFPLL
jgi:hypothetical protein